MQQGQIFRLDTHEPVIGKSCYIAPGAVVIGKVVLGEDVGVWFNAVIRGDNDHISIGDGSNIQDGSVLHADPGYPLSIGSRVTVGHKVMLHGCTIGDGTLIGMSAIVMNGAKIGRECVIGAGALIREGAEIPDRSLVVGVPGKVIRQVSDEMIKDVNVGVEVYIAKVHSYQQHLHRVKMPGDCC